MLEVSRHRSVQRRELSPPEPQRAPGSEAPRATPRIRAVARAASLENGAKTELDRQVLRLLGWLDAKVAAEPERWFVPEVRRAARLEKSEATQNAKTQELYKRTFTSFLWTGFECSNPLVERAHRWDQNQIAGFYDLAERKKQIELARSLGLENARVGLPNHLIARGEGYDWSAFDAIYRDLQAGAAGKKIKTSLDIIHFGLPDSMRDPDPAKSNFLNPRWPEHFADFALAAVKRYPGIEAVTLVNEPFVTNNFSASHWNEAVGGDEAFIRRAILIGKAATSARSKIEEYLQETEQRKLFIHNESCEYRSDDPEFDLHKRFLTSDLILGADWLMREDWRECSMVAWIRKQAETPGAAAAIERDLETIRGRHLGFAERFGRTMKADTIFGIDYYVTCEAGPGITHSPREYKKETQKTRRGLYEMGMEYHARYRLPMFHAETNMAEDKGADWMTQQLIELGALVKSGVPVLGATWYSLMDQAGWENGLHAPVLTSRGDAERAGRLNPIGLVELGSHRVRASGDLISELGAVMAAPSPPRARVCRSGRRAGADAAASRISSTR